jgi:hypothetical protein
MAAGKKGTAVHGTRSMYSLGCRCVECRAAVARASREYRERLRQRGVEHPELVAHGTYNAYVNWKCRCEACTTANREYQGTRERKRTRWERYSAATAAREKREREQAE